jgi:hypothetical protein
MAHKLGIRRNQLYKYWRRKINMAKILIEKWRMEYSMVMQHSSLNYRPRAPEAHLN